MHDGFSLLRPFCMKKVHCIELDSWFYGYGGAQCSIQGCTVSLHILRQCKLVGCSFVLDVQHVVGTQWREWPWAMY